MTASNDTGAHRVALRFYDAAGRGQRSDFETVRAAARERWPSILAALGIADEFLRDRHGPCPGCDGRDRFRFDDREGAGTFVCSQGGGAPLAGDGFELLRHAFGWTAAEALRRVADVLGLRDGRELPRIEPRAPVLAKADPVEIARTRDRLNRLWTAAHPLDHADADPARRYLAARHLDELVAQIDLPADLRLHPALPYWHPDADGRPVRIAELPALLALVRSPSGEAIGLHSTWLRRDGAGKATLTDPANGSPLPARKLRCIRRGASMGAAVRLYAAGERLAIGEGLETVTAVRIADPMLPVWAAISAGGLAAVALPECVRDLLIIVDADAAGARASLALAGRARAEGRSVRVLVPEGCRHGA